MSVGCLHCPCVSATAVVQVVVLMTGSFEGPLCVQITAMFEKTFPGKSVLGSWEENDGESEGDEDGDVLIDARAEVAELDLGLDLGKLAL